MPSHPQGAGDRMCRHPKHATVYLKDHAKTASVKSTTEAAQPKDRDSRSTHNLSASKSRANKSCRSWGR